MKIAICDDNMKYINTVEDYLDKMKSSKIDHDVFMSGEELLREYERNEADYDAIFLDMEMTGLDGIETANIIRQFDKNVIIVFVTSHKKYMHVVFNACLFDF